MLQMKVEELEEELLDKILTDAYYWLIDLLGDRSIELNKPNYTKKYSPLKRFTFKQHLEFVWDYKATNLPWCYYGQWAEYQTNNNRIVLHCDKRHTLEFVLECLFHEYKHSQQSISLYFKHKVAYEDHPFEKEANDFASEYVSIFWKKYSKKLLDENKVLSLQ